MRFPHRCRSSSHEPRPRLASTRALLAFVLGLAGASCGDANAPPGPVIGPPGVIPLTPIELTTYDGSGQVVHPDVLANLGGSGGYWLAITPYPQGDAEHENPSFYQSGSGSGSGLTWQVPEGLLNPVAKPAAGHFSDPDLVHDPVSGELAKGRVTIPLEIRERLGLLPHTEVEFDIKGDTVVLKKREPLPWEAGFLAGKCFLGYRGRGGLHTWQ
jgi:AbrB family looped-hinge helix DNA binding protein